LEDCHPCTGKILLHFCLILVLTFYLCFSMIEFEKNSQSVGSCVATGYKEKIRCETSGDTFRRYSTFQEK
jgi:hypothetical protein